MQDPKEPTEAQYNAAIEKLHTSVEGVQGLDRPIPADKPWLNSFDSIDGIVRAFTSDTLKRFSEIDKDFTIEAFTAWAQAECDRYNHLFLTYGLSPDTDYTRGVWNTPENLGVFLLIANGMNGDAQKAVRDVFMAHVVNVTKAFSDHHDEPVEQWGWMLDALMESLIANLLGLHEYDESLLGPTAPAQE